MSGEIVSNGSNEVSSGTNVMKISSLITSTVEEPQPLPQKPKKRNQSIPNMNPPPMQQSEDPPFDPNTNVIDIEIPISTHYDIHTEFNLPWLMEEKYGVGPTSLITSKWQADDNAGVAVDEDGDGADDDDEDDEEEESNTVVSNSVPPPTIGEDDFIVPDDPKKPSDDHAIVKLLGIQFDTKMTDSEKETLVLHALNKREAKNNQRLGKYDVYDPFIDDEELEVEEQGSHVEGWFIWTGELADSNGTDISKIIEKEQQRHEVIDTGVEKEADVVEILEPKKRRSDNGPSPSEALEPKKRKKAKSIPPKSVVEEQESVIIDTPSVEPPVSVTPSEDLPPPIVEKGPVVASSKTSSNQIIIGSFTGF